jgi:hypothetical protein
LQTYFEFGLSLIKGAIYLEKLTGYRNPLKTKNVIGGKPIEINHHRGARWPRDHCAWRAIAEVKQRWSVIRRVTKNELSRASPCFGRHVKPLVSAGFAVVSTH